METTTMGTLHKLTDTSLTVADPAEDIRGRTVKALDGEDLGKVDDLMLDETEGRVRFLEVGSGGFLGIGKDRSLVPVEAIRSITEGEVFISQSRQAVVAAPDYDPDLAPDAATQYWAGLYGHYGYPPYWTGGYVYPSYPHYPAP